MLVSIEAYKATGGTYRCPTCYLLFHNIQSNLHYYEKSFAQLVHSSSCFSGSCYVVTSSGVLYTA